MEVACQSYIDRLLYTKKIHVYRKISENETEAAYGAWMIVE
jgi:hypothetical protein